MKKLALILILTPCLAHAATFERVQDAFIGWHYTYQAAVEGMQMPIYFALRHCTGPSVAASEGTSPLKECFQTEAEARVEAQKWADKEEIRYRDVRNPPSLKERVMRLIIGTH
jgi:hypothetical protein